MQKAFRPELPSLLQRGWVIAYVHVRGGGDLGVAWHDAGKKMFKQRSIDDLKVLSVQGTYDIPDVERQYLPQQEAVSWLVARGYSRRGRVAGKGYSAGGMLLAAACNQDPALFSALVLRFPFVDVLTAMMDPSLGLTAHEGDEWGDPIQSIGQFSLPHEIML